MRSASSSAFKMLGELPLQNADDVAFVGEHGELVGEDVVVALVVAEAGDHGRVLGQRVGPDARPLGFRQRIEEVVSQVRGVAGAATVAAQEHLPSRAPALAQVLGESTTGVQSNPSSMSDRRCE